jgi:hypothetical protein
LSLDQAKEQVEAILDRRLFLATAVLACAAGFGALAQTATVSRVRGTISSLDGNTLTVNSRDGQKVEIVLKDGFSVSTVKKLALSAIEPGSFIGTASRTGTDGKPTAIEVLVFPEALRGTGEGSYPWDLEPGSTMTNGTVKGVVTATSGRELTIGFKDSSNTVVVPPDAAIVTLAPGTRDDLKADERVFVVATKNADGKWGAARVTVGKDGVVPPM